MRRTILLIAVLPMLVAVLGPAAATADQVYPSEHIPLMPVGDDPLRSGFVENIHASGPVVFAMERYVVNGASPRTTYDVMLHIWIEDTSCAGDPDLMLPSGSFSTNTAGNGVGMVRFSPEDAAGLRGMTLGIVWTVSTGGAVAYATGCEDVTLD